MPCGPKTRGDPRRASPPGIALSQLDQIVLMQNGPGRSVPPNVPAPSIPSPGPAAGPVVAAQMQKGPRSLTRARPRIVTRPPNQHQYTLRIGQRQIKNPSSPRSTRLWRATPGRRQRERILTQPATLARPQAVPWRAAPWRGEPAVACHGTTPRDPSQVLRFRTTSAPSPAASSARVAGSGVATGPPWSRPSAPVCSAKALSILS